MLGKNSKALSTIDTLSSGQIFDLIKDVRGYGSFPETFARLKEASPCSSVVAALDNEDSDAMLNVLLEKNPEGVLAGIKAAMKASGAKEAFCFVRDEKYCAPLKELADKYLPELTVEVEEIVDVRKYADSLMLNFETAAAYADVVTGTEPGVILQINDEEPSEISFGTAFAELSDEPVKAYKIAHRFISPDLTTVSPDFCRGSGKVTGIRDDQCLIRCALGELHELRERTCGKCTFCREGLFQLESIFRDITNGKASIDDLEIIRELGDTMVYLNNCSLGKSAVLPAVSLMENFIKEVEEHIRDRYCRAEECKVFTTYYIDSAKCRACCECVKVCEAGCIETKKGYTSVIDEFDCIKCGKCLTACPNGAISKVSGGKQKVIQKAVRLKGVAKETVEKKERNRISREASRHKTKIMPFMSADDTAPAEKKASVQITIERGKIMKTFETDVVVVAGGPAGLAAAVTLGEHGLKSILLEKANTTGGAANMGMGPLGIETRIQKQQFESLKVEEAIDMHMRYTHYQVDADLVQKYFHKSASTIEWLESLGVEFAGAFRYFQESEATWHIVKPDNGVIGPRAAGKMAKILTEKATEYGTEIFLETAATELICEDGKVCGVIAKDKDGNFIEARAKAVVVATGGFGNNKEMIREEFGLNVGVDYFPFTLPGLNGDGLKMMWKAGAMKYPTNIEAIYQLPDNANWSVLDGVLRQPNLLINQFGERFMSEGEMGNTTFTGNALRQQPGHYAYCIMDEGILKDYKKNGPDMISLVHSPTAVYEFDEQAEKAVEQGYGAYFEAKTVPELAEKLGIDPDVLQDTIDEYNEMCETGIDTKFHKNHRFLHPITGKGKYIVGKFYLGAYGTLGGVRINKYCEVLDEDLMPIEGLYAAGTDANNIYGDSYNFTLPGNSMGFAVNSGRMAAESIAEYLGE